MRYLILLGTTTIADVTGCEVAYEIYRKTCELGELLCQEEELVDYETGEVIKSNGEDL